MPNQASFGDRTGFTPVSSSRFGPVGTFSGQMLPYPAFGHGVST